MSPPRRLSARAWALATALSGLAILGMFAMRFALLNSLLYFPLRELEATPAEVGLRFEERTLATSDGQRLHAWWIFSPAPRPSGRIVYFHGNGGNISHRLGPVRALADAGFETLLFDYRGYGRSTGAPDEAGTYRDARAAWDEALRQPGAEGTPLISLGESLGGAVAVELALEKPPGGLVLQSTFTSVREMGRVHYPVIPGMMVPDAYPTLSRLRRLRVPLLFLHGDADEIVPLAQGRALFAAAAEPKRLEIFAAAGHNDLLEVAGERYARVIAEWARTLPRSPSR